MLLIDYLSFTSKYLAYLNPPYTAQDLTDKIDEALMLFPAIETCLPENNRLLATKYAVEYLYSQECPDLSYGVVESIKSRNEAITYSLKGKGNDLVNSLWGGRLVRLLKSHGCYHYFGQKEVCPIQCNC
jgi:hypothetical protein